MVGPTAHTRVRVLSVKFALSVIRTRTPVGINCMKQNSVPAPITTVLSATFPQPNALYIKKEETDEEYKEAMRQHKIAVMNSILPSLPCLEESDKVFSPALPHSESALCARNGSPLGRRLNVPFFKIANSGQEFSSHFSKNRS